MKNPKSWLYCIVIALFGLAACSGTGQWIPGMGGQPTFFQPPTQAAGLRPLMPATPTPQPAITVVVPIPTPECSNMLTYLEDVTIPDGTLTKPGDALDKRWLVQNDGSCNWNAKYRLKLISGDAMGVPTAQALYPARGGTQAVLRILFTAPGELGVSRSAWQAVSPEGEAFGDPIYIEVLIESSQP